MTYPLNGSPLALLVCVWLGLSSCTGQENHTALPAQAEDITEGGALSVLVDRPMKPQLIGPYSREVHTLEPALQLRLYITDIAQDHTGAMWFGTHGYGVVRYHNDSLDFLTEKEGFGSAEVRQMVEDRQGHLWFATADGLIAHPVGAGTDAFVQYTESDGLAHRDVRSLALDPEGRLWIGTAHGVSLLHTPGIAPGTKGLVSAFELPASTSGDRAVHSITADRRGRIWFGTGQGVYVYTADAPAPFARLTTRDGLCGDEVRDILEAKNGRMWFATKAHGVCYLEAGFEPGQEALRFSPMYTKPGHEGTQVDHLFEDATGSIWFSVKGVGTYRYAQGSLSPYFQSQSCVSHTFSTTFQDWKGRIWFGGSLGLFRYLDPC